MMLLSILYLAFCYKNYVTVHFVFGILPEIYKIMFIRTTILLSYLMISKLQYHYLQEASHCILNKIQLHLQLGCGY